MLLEIDRLEQASVGRVNYYFKNCRFTEQFGDSTSHQFRWAFISIQILSLISQSIITANPDQRFSLIYTE